MILYSTENAHRGTLGFTPTPTLNQPTLAIRRRARYDSTAQDISARLEAETRSMQRWSAIVGVILLSLAAENSVLGQQDARRDVHSLGNPRQIAVKHVALDLTVDFPNKQLKGTATLTIERKPRAPKNAPLVLDTRDLTIESVDAGAADKLDEVKWSLGNPHRILGAALRIEIPPSATTVRIKYHTSPNASALQWLEPAQTAGKKRPFLFSQSQAIHARSWIPLQDSPGVRVTYDAAIRVPEGLTAVMSADRVSQEGTVTRFKMEQAIPSYLIALAVGDLVFRPLGTRTGVFAEPSLIDAASHEFADTERMVAAAESLYGPYRWGRYDLLVLPPSFPFGGMENAKLTFVTPTVIAGDRSLVSLIAHELAHSWSGNLVTGATWRDFWLNEGFTTYIERRIVEELYGKEFAAMEAVGGARDLRDELAKFAPADEILHIDLSGRDPDDGMTRVPYEKGAFFLQALELKFGRAKFDAFLRDYFNHFAFQSITTADFEAYLREHLFEKGVVEPIDIPLWLHRPGLPADCPKPESERLSALEAQARDWAAGKLSAAELKAEPWRSLEWVHFLRSLPKKIAAGKMAELDAAYDLTDKGNTEILEAWLVLAIHNNYQAADHRLEQFLSTIGRRKYLMPIYTELASTPRGKERAKAIFATARPNYHSIAAESVAALLGVK